MTTKEYLEQLPNMQIRINAIKRKIAECKERATDISIKQASDSQHNGNVTNKIENNMDKKIDLEKELENLKNQFESFEVRVIAEINKIPNSLYSGLLFEKYINGLSWEEVAEVIGKGTEYTRKELHSKALLEFDIYTPENTRKSPCTFLRDSLQ